ncbi:MAG: hypothetical protein KAG92_08005, partial [Deltaproteobacteria bacterium]|nr:hypothetical protein [Deltaproteobacteria bacterium]
MTLSRHNRHHPTRIGAATEENFSPETRSHLSDKSLERNRLDGFDYLTCLLTIILIAFGVLTIYSATYNPEAGSWLTGHCRKQLIWIAIALIVGMAIFVVHYNIFYQAAYPLYGLGIILLLAVEIAGSTHMG